LVGELRPDLHVHDAEVELWLGIVGPKRDGLLERLAPERGLAQVVGQEPADLVVGLGSVVGGLGRIANQFDVVLVGLDRVGVTALLREARGALEHCELVLAPGDREQHDARARRRDEPCNQHATHARSSECATRSS